jgi:hypothetical protein
VTQLYDHIATKNPEGLPYSEALQMFIWVYCVTDILPLSLRAVPVGREELVESFRQLARDGFIHALGPIDPGINSSSHWDKVIADLLANRISLDPQFPTRARQYL